MNNQPLNCHIQPNTPFGAILTPQHPGQKVNELPVAALRALAQEHHLLVLRGFDSGFSEPEVLTRYAEQWGEIMMWPFGAVLDVKEHPDAKDHIFDSSYVPLHWDGMYKPTIPEFQLFHCVAAPSPDEGGCTTFVDTTRLLANADEALLEQWLSVSITYRIKQVVHYGGEVCSPLVVQHPNGRGLIMRYNEPPTEGKKFLNQHALEYHGVPAQQQEQFHRTLQQHLYDPRHYYAHQWQQGDVVVADNFSLLHGREGFTARSARHLQRVHIQSNPVCANLALKPANAEA
ncbi:TauD/TfdA family dioxygenase [Serratia ureilytica]|uniref:TauD/TfdA dioxygenase family protein n=1 Tax=Serratia ureilytica TaxID=300181 RepID=UPI0019D1D392|nr:TauD/TfdA family dioxygenase [Serratia ureilytica]MBN5358113.1 TauD/TfdA family dioxygenase [Serratia ureilytica]UNE44554.1 TauD/TfdA family dioxygenase [Serratia ureilytica]